MLTIEKFPKVFFENRKLVWDSRQPIESSPEIVIVPPDHINKSVKEDLLSRPNAIFVGAKSSGLNIEVDDPRSFLAEACSKFYSNPSSRLKIFGVTGTNGKTTCASLLRAIFVTNGHSTAEIGTLGISIWRPYSTEPELNLETGFTTPEAPTLHKLFADLLDVGVTHVVMELSSHAAVLSRIAAIDLDAALFTNLSQDHLDFHGSMLSYEEAKKKIMVDLLLGPPESKKKKYAILNGNDSAGKRIFDSIPIQIKKELYGEGLNFKIRNQSISGSEILLNTVTFSTQLVGNFNAENVAGSASLALAVGISPEIIQKSLLLFGAAKGRLERVSPLNSKVSVFVDFAHSPDALEKTLKTLNSLKVESSQLWVVFGCGGDRDCQKRPLMGAIADELASRIVLTSDNPRTENPKEILDAIQSGVSREGHAKLVVQPDRSQAILFALKNLLPGDVCVIAGKGHEEYQIIGTTKYPFSDQNVCKMFFES